MDCRLVLITGGLEQTFPLPDGKTTIGREVDNVIQLNSRRVSRHHAHIFNTPYVVEITDLGARNGTYVNGNPITTTTLRNGDEIRIDEFILQYQEIAHGNVVDLSSGYKESSTRTREGTITVKTADLERRRQAEEDEEGEDEEDEEEYEDEED